MSPERVIADLAGCHFEGGASSGRLVYPLLLLAPDGKQDSLAGPVLEDFLQQRP